MKDRQWRPGWRVRWRRWRRAWAKRAEALRRWWRRRWPRWRAELAERAPGAAFWALVLTAWALLTWAAVDAVPPGWEAAVVKASAGAFLAGLVGGKLWAKILDYGVFILRDMELPEGHRES